MSHNKKYSEHIQIIQNAKISLTLNLHCLDSANTIILKLIELNIMKRACSLQTKTRMKWNEVEIREANIHMRVPSGLKKQIIFE
jgi:hypothetical protein